MPHVGYSDREVEEVYDLLKQERAHAAKTGRKLIFGGDWNAVVGKRYGGEPRSIVGEHGMGVRNARGRMMVEWATMEDLAIMGTMFRKKEDDSWTHTSGGRRRQIDFFVVDQGLRRVVENSDAGNEIGVGNDHRAVRLVLVYGERGGRRRYHPRKKSSNFKAWGWSPADREAYAKQLDEELEKMWAQNGTRGQLTWMDEKWKEIEETLTRVAETCNAIEEKAKDYEQMLSQASKGLIEKRREARGRGDQSQGQQQDSEKKRPRR